MLKTLTVAAGLFVAGMSMAAAPVSAAPASNVTFADHGLVDTVQYGYGERRYEGRGYGPRPARVIRRILGGRPGYRERGYRDRGFRGRGYGYGRDRGYGRGRFDRY